MLRRARQIIVVTPLFLLCLFGCAGLHPAGEQSGAKVSVTKLISSTNCWDGALLPAYPRQQPNITILRIRIPPGVRLHTHKHPIINAGVLLSGQLTVVTTKGATLHLVAGDPIIEVVNTLHYGINEGKTAAEIMVFYAGTLDDPPSILEKTE
jgi:quercetin dioxygenase-like cupin family protein